jgi:energy-coupling factor transporter ATP-binding protein EcfA2
MTLHKLNPAPATESLQPLAATLGIDQREYSLARAIMKARVVQANRLAMTAFPIYRYVRFAVHGSVEDVFDDFALLAGMVPQRLFSGSLLLEGPGAFANLYGCAKAGYCSCTVEVWADSPARAQEVRATLLKIVDTRRVRHETFVIDWHFTSNGGSLSNSSFEELAEDELHDEAYPILGEPVLDFVRRFLAASETVLVILGPPGAGKTRLVRALLGEISRRKGASAEIMYTCDKKTLENDEIFVSFITGSHEAFVIEDADHILTPRAHGNIDLHRFLAIADGVVRAQGRKIIFTTNLPNVGDLDEALLRPGRCFAAVHTRSLTAAEGAKLIAKLCGGEVEREKEALAAVFPVGVKSASVASIYRACGSRAIIKAGV